MEAQPDGAPDVDEQILFSESGASLWWLALGPFSAVSIAGMELWSSHHVDPLVPLAFLVIVTGFMWIQTKAARIHTSVELTREFLRQGTESIPTDAIVEIYPPANGEEPWESARALGELTGVPRGRTGIGLRLTGDRTAQAWARRHHGLRAALESVMATE
ncbi:MAG: DUF3093 domain-containing protein [Mycobacterium sp.]